MHDNEYTSTPVNTKRDPAVFIVAMVCIKERARLWITENRGSTFKTDTMLGRLSFAFLGSHAKMYRNEPPQQHTLIVKSSSISAMEFPLLAELLSHLCKGYAGFIGTGTGEQAIVEVFPQVSMLLEIDEHGGFLAPVIHNELNTFHLLAILLKCSEG